MLNERCVECGFDGSDWTDGEAIGAIEGLPARWSDAIDGLTDAALGRRPIAGMWSIAEYTDHVRETAFGMRFILDIACTETGTDLGAPPDPAFDPQPRLVDVPRTLSAFEREVDQLCERLHATPGDAWESWVAIAGEPVDVHWIARHAVHDVTHHLRDVARLRAALGE